MSDTAQSWNNKNDLHLSLAMEWLRTKLTDLATSSENKDYVDRNTNSSSTVSAKEAQIRALEADEPLPVLEFVRRRFGLSMFEYNILLLCVAMELDTRIPGLCAKAHDDPAKPYPTFSLAMMLFDEPVWDVLALQRPLRYWRLIEINRLMNLPLISSPLRIDERMINFIKGLNYLDERIARLTSPFDVDGKDVELPPSQERTTAALVNTILGTSQKHFPIIIQLVGQDSLSKQLVAQKAAASLNIHLICLPAELLPTQTQESEDFARLWQRESLLLPIAGYIDAHKTESLGKHVAENSGSNLSLQRFLRISQGVFFLDVKEMSSELSSFSTIVEVKKPTPLEQRTAWDQLLGERANGSASLLAGQFNLNIVTIDQVINRVTSDKANANDHLHDHLWQTCLSSTSPELDMLVQKLELKSTWKDIVLPESSANQLRQIASQVKYRSLVYDSWGYRDKMNRGLGINALFIGESGTGKTMAAEVLANELNLHLYRIDLSGVVSKYIGETEKNLRRLFDAAEDGGAILFFDEADALFGKRSEVKDSHDRYANIEINYLLQRMESFNGLAILATNKKSALDDAFVRRLRFIVHFPFPGIKERKMITQKIFPPHVPKGTIDYDRIASLNLTGGSFHNVSINAAFKAAEEGVPVSMPLILSAAKAEFQKLERPIKESDFVWSE